MKATIISMLMLFMGIFNAEAVTWESLLNAKSGNNDLLTMAILDKGE